MGFKMKTPSTHEGTERHRQEIKQYKELQVNRTMDGTSLPDGRPGSSPAQFKPTISLKPKKKDLLGSDKMISDLQKKTNDALFKIKTANMTKKQKKKLNKSLAADKKFIEDAKKNIGTDKKTKYDKPGTVVSRAAEKVGETLNPWSIKNRAKRQSQKKTSQNQTTSEDDKKKKTDSEKIGDAIGGGLKAAGERMGGHIDKPDIIQTGSTSTSGEQSNVPDVTTIITSKESNIKPISYTKKSKRTTSKWGFDYDEEEDIPITKKSGFKMKKSPYKNYKTGYYGVK